MEDRALRDSVRRLTNAEIEQSNDRYQKQVLSDMDPFRTERLVGAHGKRARPEAELHEDEEDDGAVDDAMSIGIKRGKSSFTIDPLRRTWEDDQGVPREDGREWPEGSEGEGGYYEAKYRTEEEARRQLLESHPDYQFINLVAGHTNAAVVQLYEEGDVSSIVRRQQALMTQQRIALEEVRATTEQVAKDVAGLTAEIASLRTERKDHRTVLLESDRLIQALAFASTAYEQEDVDRLQLLRKRDVLARYASPVRTDELFAEIADVLQSAATREVDAWETRGADPGSEEDRLVASVAEARDIASDPPATGAPDANLRLAVALVDLWFSRDDPEGFAVFRAAPTQASRNTARNTYVSDAIDAGGPVSSDLDDSVISLANARADVVRQFYPVLFFLDQANVLVIDRSDIYVDLLPEEGVARRPFEFVRVDALYTRYGGTLFGKPTRNTEEYRTTEFREIWRGVAERAAEDEDLRKRLASTRSGPYLDEMKAFREWVAPKIEELQADIDRLDRQLDASRERLTHLRTGTVTFRDIEQPYRHRGEWVNAPEHSGIVRLKPIVVAGIDDAYGLLKRQTSYASNTGLEFLQHDEEIRGDFALLVAIKMSFAAMRFPRQYLQLGMRSFSKDDEIEVANRLIYAYDISVDSTGVELAYRARTRSRQERGVARSGVPEMLRDVRDVIVFS